MPHSLVIWLKRKADVHIYLASWQRVVLDRIRIAISEQEIQALAVAAEDFTDAYPTRIQRHADRRLAELKVPKGA